MNDAYAAAMLLVRTAVALVAWRIVWVEGGRARSSRLGSTGWVLMAAAFTGGAGLRVAVSAGVPTDDPWLRSVSLASSVLFLVAVVLLRRYYAERARINAAAADELRRQLAEHGITDAGLRGRD